MASIDLGDCSVRRSQEGEFQDVSVLTPPGTLGDTIDLSSILHGRKIVDMSVFNIDDPAETTFSLNSSNVATLGGPAGGDSYSVNIRVMIDDQ